MRYGASTFIWASPFSNKTLDLLDAFNRAADEAVSRTGREPLFASNGAGRLRIPILTQSPLPFD